MGRTAEILVIGNEILSGKVRDVNGPFLIEQLRELGVDLRRVTVVPDVVDVIAKAAAESSARADFVLATGGVGPTLDDLTFVSMSRAFGSPMRRFPELADVIREFFGADQTTEAHLKMADLPAESALVYSPGLKFPVVCVRNVYVFPGSPEICRKKFLALREQFREAPFVLRRVFVKLEEGLLSPALDEVARQEPGVALGSYPVFDDPDYSVQVTIESKDGSTVDRALAVLLSQLDAAVVHRVV